ncbi:DUF5666 domain-containing protein [Kaarinaea lacus]
MNLPLFRGFIFSLLISVLLLACSGGESGTGLVSSEPKVSVGVITGFGSVFVNGVKFDTSEAEISVNDSVADEQDLSIGMVVAVVGSTNRAEVIGKADAIYYESEVCGIVRQNNQDGILDVMGQIVKYDTDTVFESDDVTVAMIEDIPEDAVVDVSGYRIGDNTLHATHLTLVSKTYTAGAEITVKGVITAGLVNGTFSMGTLTVAMDSSTIFIDIPNQQLNPGMVVKVKSERDALNNVLQADTIAPGTSEYVDVGGTLEIEGLIMNAGVTPNQFQLNGYTVYFSNQTNFEGGTASDLADGVKVEVEGEILSASEIDARDISFRKTAKVELTAPVTSINSVDNQVNVSGVIVELTNKTLLKDDDTKVRRFSLADLNIGDKVKVKAYQDNLSGDVIATQFRRVETGSVDTTFEMRGVLDELTATQAIISGIGVDLIQIITPDLDQLSQSIGTVVTVSGVAPLTNQ